VEFYPDVYDKAAVLVCRLAWNHPLVDGNKRAAWAALVMFIGLNDGAWDPDPPDIDQAEEAMLAIAAGSERGYLVWLVNPRTGEVERHPLSPPTWANPAAEELSPGAVAWVNDRWVMALVDAILVSGDGATWTQVPDEDTFKPYLWANTLTAGPTGVIATTCEGLGHHYVWFSEDGLKWENTKVDAFHVEPAYADALGFVVIPTGVDGSGDQVMVSPHGRTWHGATVAGLAAFGPENLAVSGLTVFGHEGENAFLLKYE